jgi:hypothetical protein
MTPKPSVQQKEDLDFNDLPFPGSFIITDLSRRVSKLEELQQQTLPLIGKMEAAFDAFFGISEDVKEIKSDVKTVVSTQNNVEIQLVNFDNRVKSLEEEQAMAKRVKEERKSLVRKGLFGTLFTVAGAALVYLLGWK